MRQNNVNSNKKNDWTHDPDTNEPRISRRGDGRRGGHAQKKGSNGWGLYNKGFKALTLSGDNLKMLRIAQAMGLPVDYKNGRLRIQHPKRKKGFNLQCCAKTRKGTQCKMRSFMRADGTFSKRCRLHGGLSTGPKTQAGRDAIAESNRRRSKKQDGKL